jgi:hypothetical protein
MPARGTSTMASAERQQSGVLRHHSQLDQPLPAPALSRLRWYLPWRSLMLTRFLHVLGHGHDRHRVYAHHVHAPARAYRTPSSWCSAAMGNVHFRGFWTLNQRMTRSRSSLKMMRMTTTPIFGRIMSLYYAGVWNAHCHRSRTLPLSVTRDCHDRRGR